MSVSTHMKPGLTDKSRVKIMTVDIPTRRIEAVIKDGSMIQVAVWETPQAFRWPVEGEIWIVRRDGGIWMLDKRVQTAVAEPLPVTNMSPGDMKLDSSSVYDAQGHRVVTATSQGLTAPMVAGSILVLNAAITSVSQLTLTRQAGGTNPGAVFESARVPGVSFMVTSTNSTDTGRVAYQIVEPWS